MRSSIGVRALRISVVIPTLDEADSIGDLVRVLWSYGFDDIVVADGGSSDGTVQIASSAGARVLVARRGRGEQLQAGAHAAMSDYLFFLHADSTPPPNARAAILETLSMPGVVAGSFCLRFERAHPLLSLYALISRVNHTLFTYGDQGLFLARSVFDRIGGYGDAPIFEDADILQRLKRTGKFVKRPEAITTSARRFLRDGVALRELINVGLVCLYHLGVPPRRLERWYGADRAQRE